MIEHLTVVSSRLTTSEVSLLCPYAIHSIRCLALVQPRKIFHNIDWEVINQNKTTKAVFLGENYVLQTQTEPASMLTKIITSSLLCYNDTLYKESIISRESMHK